MPLDNFYRYKIDKHIDNEIYAFVHVNKTHKIFEGHFPSQPIIPGVVQILMIKEILSHCLNVEMQLNSSKSIKFLSMINPNETDAIQVSIAYKIEDGNYNINARLHHQEQNFLKFRGVYCERR